jgi:hypothetical protein
MDAIKMFELAQGSAAKAGRMWRAALKLLDKDMVCSNRRPSGPGPGE